VRVGEIGTTAKRSVTWQSRSDVLDLLPGPIPYSQKYLPAPGESTRSVRLTNARFGPHGEWYRGADKP